MTNRLRSLASRVMMSWVRPSARPPRAPPPLGCLRQTASRRATRGAARSAGPANDRPPAERARRERRARDRAMRPARLPLSACHAVANGREVQLLGFEEPRRRGKMFLARAELPALAPARRAASCARARRTATSSTQRLQVPERLVGLRRKACRPGAPARRRGRRGSGASARSASCRTAGCGRSPAHPGSRRRTARPRPAAVPASSVSIPSSAAAAISSASTKQSSRSSAIMSPEVTTRWRPGSSRTLLSLLRHQRSSPRGSFGTSHRSSQRRLRPTGMRRERQIGEERPHLARCRAAASAAPSRPIVSGPSIRTRMPAVAPSGSAKTGFPRAFPRLLPRWPLRRCSITEIDGRIRGAFGVRAG